MLKWSLYLGGIYFFLISVVHIFTLKFPGFYIYFNVPSYEYQDKIIAFLTIGWSIFFIQAGANPLKYKSLIRSILLAGLAAVCGLSFINLSTNFSNYSPKISVTNFWIQVGVLLLYLFWLYFLYIRMIKLSRPNS